MLKELRVNAGITQVELGKHLGVQQNTISNWETGRSRPDIEKTAKIAEVLGVTTDEVIDCFIEKK